MTSARAFFQRSPSVERLGTRASAFFHRLRADSRGAGLVEYMIILGFIALFAIGVLTRYGSVIHDGLQSEASRIEGENLPTTGDLLGSLGNVTPSVCDLSSSRFCARGSGSPIPSLGALGTKGGVPGMDDLGSGQRKGFASRVSEGSGFGMPDLPDLGDGMDRLGQVPDEPGALARATPSSGFVEDKTGRRSIDELLNGERRSDGGVPVGLPELLDQPKPDLGPDLRTALIPCQTPEKCQEIADGVNGLGPGGVALKGARAGASILGRVARWLASKLGLGAARGASTVLRRTPAQLASKFKHAKDFGVAGNYSKANAAKFSRAIHQHVNSPGVRAIPGTYHKQPVTHYLNPLTGLNVIADPAGNFISGWKLSPTQLQNVLTHGGL